MKYKEVASKIFYMGGVIMIFSLLGFFSFLLYKSLHSEELTPFFIMIVLISISMFMLFFYFRKFIYGKIDLEKQVFIFGNLLMENEIPTKEIEYVGRVLFYNSVVKIKIAGQNYYYISQGSDSENYFK